MNFDEIIERRNTHSMKWDLMETFYGVSPDNGLAMWVADMDFRPPPAVNDALQAMVDHGVHGYFGNEGEHKQAICQWMHKRHNWNPAPEAIHTVHGLVNGTALCIQAFTRPGDGIILFTPVYHAFSRVIRANQREVIESPLVNNGGRYELDLEALAGQLTGHETMLIFCSPHNPSGRVWTKAELQAVADFCIEHDLVLVSDEIHHDLVYASARHTAMARLAEQQEALRKRLVMLTATTKTFNIAGGLTGNVIIEDDNLRAKFAMAHQASGTSPNRFGTMIATAAYQHGEAWLEELIPYLDENRKLLDEGINAIPGLSSMPMESTYLAWVDFSSSGLTQEQIIHKVQNEAGIAVNHGSVFGKGGENFLRFNFATPRSRVEEAVKRLQRVFG
ncbi:MAG: MalY/PatB family protein [Thiolinea sp.]